MFHESPRALGQLLLVGAILLLSACSAAGLTGTLRVLDPDGEPGPALDGRTVSGEVRIVFEPTEDVIFERVRFQLNGGVPDEPPWSEAGDSDLAIVLDSPRLFDGAHTVSVVAVGEGGQRIPGSVTATFTVHNRGTDHADRMPRADGLTLRGDPDFEPELLNRDMRAWYERMWEGIEQGVDEMAASGDLREYGYPFQQYVAYLTTALRATGDLRFADELARLADLMADALVTEWYDRERDRWYEPDDGTEGLRRFVLRFPEAGDDSGKDTQVLSSTLAHGMIANMAYAFDANRGAESPGGVDYGTKADFWTDYLVNDFEAIWRIRSGSGWLEYPLWNHQVAHTFKSQMRWAYYMHELTGRSDYLRVAEAYADAVMEHTFAVDTPDGPALVWSHRLLDPQYGLQPIAYARYEYAIETDLALEGALPGIDAEYMAMHARTLRRFVLDNGAENLAFDVGGMKAREGTSLAGNRRAILPSRDPWDHSGLRHERESFDRFVLSYLTPLAYFGATEHIAGISEQVYGDRREAPSDPQALAIPAGMLLIEGLPR